MFERGELQSDYSGIKRLYKAIDRIDRMLPLNLLLYLPRDDLMDELESVKKQMLSRKK